MSRANVLSVRAVVMFLAALAFVSIGLSRSAHSQGADTTPPDTSINSGPAEGSTDTDGSVDFTWSGTDNVAVTGYQYRLFTPTDSNPAWIGVVSDTNKSYTNLPDGEYCFQVRAFDAIGNSDASAALRCFWVGNVDNTPPDTSIDSGPAEGSTDADGSVAFTWSGTDNVAVTGYQYRLFTPSDSNPAWIGVVSDTSKSYTSLPVGDYCFQVRAFDAIGNSDASAALRCFSVGNADTTPPNIVTFASPSPSNNATDNDGNFSYAWNGAEPGGSYQCSFVNQGNNDNFNFCTSPKGFTSVPNGTYTFKVRQVDAAGNIGLPASRTISVSSVSGGQPFSAKVQAEDFSKSNQSITTVDGNNDDGSHLEYLAGATSAYTASTTQTFTGSVTNVDMRVQGVTASEDLNIYLDGTAAGNIIGTVNNISSTYETRNVILSIPSGQHTIHVGPVNTLVTGEKTRFDWMQFNGDSSSGSDTTAPDTTIQGGPAADGTIDTDQVDFTYASSEANSTFLCSLVSQGSQSSYASCPVSGKSYFGLADGTYTFAVKAIDPAGNLDSSAATRTFTVNTATPPPAPTVTRYQTENFNRSNTTFITIQNLATADGGQTLRWENSATSSHTASQTFTGPVEQIDLYAKSVNGTEDLAVYVDGTSASQKVGEFTNISNAGWDTYSIPVNVSSGSHTLYLGPASGFSFTDRVSTDYVELLGQASTPGDTTPPGAPTITAPGTNGTTDTDGNLSFTFNGAESGGTYQCSLDTGTANYQACSSPQTYSTVANGSYTFSVKQTDAAGNVGPASTRTITVNVASSDTTAPNTTIDSTTNPSSGGTDTDGNVSFDFSGTDTGTGASGVSSFECTNNLSSAGDNWATCSSPKTYNGLANGSYTFKVRAKDGAGNLDASPATRSYTVNVPTAPPGGSAKVGYGTGSASDCDTTISPGSGSLQTAFNNVPASFSGDYVVCMRGGAYGGLGITQKVGSNSGNSESSRLVIKSYPNERAQIRGQLTMSNATYTTFKDVYFDNRYQPYSAGGGVTNDGNPDMTPVMLVSGQHTTITNVEVDGGNGDKTVASGTRPFNERSTCVGYRSPSDEHFTKSWIHNCGVTAQYSAQNPDGHGIYFSVANGAQPHEFSDNVLWGIPANAIDVHGSNIGPFNYEIQNNITFDSSDGATFNAFNSSTHFAHNILIDPDGQPLRYDQGQGNNVIEDNCFNGPLKINNPANLTVRNNVQDNNAYATGNPVDGNWQVNVSSACLAKYQGTMLGGGAPPGGGGGSSDTTAPTVTINSGPGDTTDGVADFTFSANESSTYECKLDAGSYSSCSSPKSYSGLANGSHTFSVRATDAASNVSSAVSNTFSVTLGGGGTGGTATIVGAGDIGEPNSTAPNDTGDLVRAQLAAGASSVFTLGDDAYPDGSAADFNANYDPGWGSFKNKTYPVLGNHEYNVSSTASGAQTYFNSSPATPVNISNNGSYYAYSVPNTNWRVLVLNSVSHTSPAGNAAPDCFVGSAQYSFALNELQTDQSTGKNVVMMWHHSRFSNGGSHNSAEAVGECPETFWNMGYDNGADLVLSGHSHMWERFQDRTKTGAVDSSGIGLTQVTIGLGGADNDTILATKDPNPDQVFTNTHGIGKVILGPNDAKVSFIAAPGASGADSATVPVR